MTTTPKRSRMIFDAPDYVQMAIKIRAVKAGVTTGGVVEEAIRQAFPDDIRDAEAAINEQARGRERG